MTDDLLAEEEGLTFGRYQHGNWCVQTITPFEDAITDSDFLHNGKCRDIRTLEDLSEVAWETPDRLRVEGKPGLWCPNCGDRLDPIPDGDGGL